MVNVWRNVPQVRIALQVHDELVVMAKHRKYGPRVAAAMCDVELGVPMLADPKYSDYSWARVAE
jgi:DNA polymerase I-like protein with 3'-5' exonuclease and polymerase domains